MSRTPAQDRRKRKFAQLSLVLLGCAAFSATFIHHAIYGRHGLEARSKLIARSTELDREIKSLEAVHGEFTRHIRLLREKPQRDLVEEIAQRTLGFAYPDEVVIRR